MERTRLMTICLVTSTIALVVLALAAVTMVATPFIWAAFETTVETAVMTVDVPVDQTAVRADERRIEGHGRESVEIQLDAGIWTVRRVHPSNGKVTVDARRSVATWDQRIQIIHVTPDFATADGLAFPLGRAHLAVATDGNWTVAFAPGAGAR